MLLDFLTYLPPYGADVGFNYYFRTSNCLTIPRRFKLQTLFLWKLGGNAMRTTET